MNRFTLLLLVLLAACERKSSPSSSTATPAPEPAPAASTPPPVPKLELAAGEKLTPVPSGLDNQLVWDAPSGKVLLAVIDRADAVVLRAFTASGATDVTKPVDVGQSGHCWIRLRGDLVFRCEPDAGILEEHHAQKITWDANAGKPVVADTWSCKDEDFDRGCEFPEWASDTAPFPPDPDRPTVDAAVDHVRTWLGAIAKNDMRAAAAMMTPDVAVQIEYEPAGDEEAGCPTGTATMNAEATATCAHGILATAKRMKGNVTRDSVRIDAPEGWQPAPHEIYVAVEGNGDEYDVVTVALVKGAASPTIRAVWMSRSIADE